MELWAHEAQRLFRAVTTGLTNVKQICSCKFIAADAILTCIDCSIEEDNVNERLPCIIISVQ